MFLLFANADSAASQSMGSRQLRAVYSRVFEALGDVRLVNSTAEIVRLADSQALDEETLIVAFNPGTEQHAEFTLPYLCIVGQGVSDTHDHNDLCLGVLTTTNAGLLQQTSGVTVAWPTWNNAFIQNLRTAITDPGIDLSNTSTETIFDTGGENLASTTLFAASFQASESSWLEELIEEFVQAFRNNKGVALRLHLTGVGSAQDKVQIAEMLSNIVTAQSNFACRIICIDSIDSRIDDIASMVCQPAFAYIANPNMNDQFAMSLYWSALVPVIAPDSLKDVYSLPNNYPWLISQERPLSDLFKGALHIAVHSPKGYRSLRRMARQSASSLLSDTYAVHALQSIMSSIGVHEEMPQLDSLWQQDSELLSAVGIREMITSGWLDQDTGTLAPGFQIGNNDVFVDIGCGSGGYSRFAAGFASKVIGCDLDAERLALADEHIREVAQCPVETIVTDGESLQLDDASADKIVCTEVLEHVDDPHQVMAELYRIGKPGATYLITVPDTLNERLQEMLAPPEYFEKPNHIRIFERDEFLELIKSSGLEVQSHSFRGFYLCFEWLIKWFDDREIDVMWARLWNYLLAHEKGPSTKEALDKYIAKSQAIIARKPSA